MLDWRKATGISLLTCFIIIGLICIGGNPETRKLSIFTPLYGEETFSFYDLQLSIHPGISMQETASSVQFHPVENEQFPVLEMMKSSLPGLSNPSDAKEQEKPDGQSPADAAFKRQSDQEKCGGHPD